VCELNLRCGVFEEGARLFRCDVARADAGHTSEELEADAMPLAEGLAALRRIGLHQAAVTVRQGFSLRRLHPAARRHPATSPADYLFANFRSPNGLPVLLDQSATWSEPGLSASLSLIAVYKLDNYP